MGRSGILAFRRKANPVIDDNMQGAAILITFQFADIKCFRNDALTRESGIPVHKNSHSFTRVQLRQSRCAPVLLSSTGEAFNHWIHEFQMARVVGQRDPRTHGFSLSYRTVCTEMVLHIAGPAVVDAHGAFGWKQLFIRGVMEL